MITLTSPVQINSLLGGSAPVGYDKLVLSPVNYNPVTQQVVANMRLSSTTQPSMQTLVGDLSITCSSGELVVQIPTIPFYRRVILTAAQITAVQGYIDTAQGNIETGLVNLGIIAGTRSSGV